LKPPGLGGGQNLQRKKRKRSNIGRIPGGKKAQLGIIHGLKRRGKGEKSNFPKRGEVESTPWR